MGERKGVNKYYPPDFDYKKHGSLDKYHNSHPLRERAKKIGEGILVIRFEMPYNIWCNGCGKHIGMGVRYNAEKIKVGNYYTTPVYKFKMKCHLCEQYFEIQTDPANCDYVILSGARRKEERWNAKDNEQIEMTDHLDKQKLTIDAMFKLEHNVKDQRKLTNALPTLEEIQDIQEEKKDDYILNKILRKNFRTEKKALEATSKKDQALLKKSSLDIRLLLESQHDQQMAKLLALDTVLVPTRNSAHIEVAARPVLGTSKQLTLGNSSASKILENALSKSLVKTGLWNSKPLKRSNPDSLSTLGVKVSRKSSKSAKDNTKLPTRPLIADASSEPKTSPESSKLIKSPTSVGNNKLPLVYYSDDSNDSDISNSDNT